MIPDYLYIISQIFITCALVGQGATYFISNRHRQLVAIIFSNLMSAACFLILGGYVAVAMNGIAILRDTTSNIINMRRGGRAADKITHTDRWLLVLWIALLTAASMVMPHGDGIMSILPYFSTMIFTVAIWQKNVLIYRFAGLITNSLLIVYNVYMNNFMGVVMQSGLLMFAAAGFVFFFIERSARIAHK